MTGENAADCFVGVDKYDFSAIGRENRNDFVARLTVGGYVEGAAGIDLGTLMFLGKN